jgi:nucleoside-diphosphate-sugar epimerase
MKKILITGSSGLIGKLIYKNLKSKYSFIGLDKYNTSENNGLKTHLIKSNQIECFSNSLKGIDTVIHLAASVSTSSEWDEVLYNNIELTKNIYEASRLNKVSRIIFASSNHAVGNFENDEPYKSIVKGKYEGIDPKKIKKINHNVSIRPDSYYGISKAFGESTARYYYEHHNIESVCLRIGTVNKENSPLSDIRYFATLLYHEDLIQLIEKSISQENIGFKIFYGVSNNKWNFWDISYSENILGYKPKRNTENER